MEAVAVRAWKHEEELRKAQERKEWREDKDGFKERLASAGVG
jgi:hypothetical protein